MSKKLNDIADDEIRIISAYKPKEVKKNRLFRLYIPVILAVMLAAAIFVALLRSNDDSDERYPEPALQEIAFDQPIVEPSPAPAKANERGAVQAIDTVIGKKALQFFYPENLHPRLVIGHDNLNDSTILLATQAADVRRDNGQIVGTFVIDGEVLSKGEAKAGFCSIINGELTIGIADSTPMLEQSLVADGYFFRQYPLVVGGQIVENKPKGKAIRKALAELDGRICVIMSRDKLTFHDFSQILIDAGVRNAIYLVGSSSYGFYVNDNGKKILTGIAPESEVENVSYIIWQ